MATVSTMNSQGKVFKVSAIAGAAGIVLPVVLLIALGNVRGAGIAVLTTALVSLLIIGGIAICIALASFREQGRKPGSTPLIYAVIAFPLGFVLMFIYLASQFTPLVVVAMLAVATSIPALIIGLVKKLSVKSVPPPMVVPSETAQ